MNEFIKQLKTYVFYIKNKNKGISRDFVEYLFQNEKELIPIINNSHTFDEINKKIRDKYLKEIKENSSSRKLFFDFNILSSLNYGIFNIYMGYYYSQPQNITSLYLNNQITVSEQKEIIEKYRDAIFEYINSNNDIRNKFYRTDDDANDLRKEITKEDINDVTSKLFLTNTNFSSNLLKNIDLIKKIIFEMEVLYPKEILLNNQEFVLFEMENGYFRKYIEVLKNNNKIISLEERLNIYEKNKNLTSAEIELLNNKELLLERLKKIDFEGKDEVIETLQKAIEDNNNLSLLEILKECSLLYEVNFRNEIVSSLYTPTASCEIEDYRDIKPIMVHSFFRDPNKFFEGYMNKYRENLINSRINLNTSKELTEEEEIEYNKHLEYARKYLFNQTYVPETANYEFQYSDANGISWYRSDTSNQLSTSIMDFSAIINNVGSYGIGFDATTLPPENIIVSSPKYLTSNKGINNLDVSSENEFHLLSAPISELVKCNKNEVVIFRKGMDLMSESSYVYVIISGLENDFYKKKDKETLEKASKIALDNKKKLVIFNASKIRESYELSISKENEKSDNTIKF